MPPGIPGGLKNGGAPEDKRTFKVCEINQQMLMHFVSNYCIFFNLVVVPVEGQRADQEASLEELVVDPVVEAHPLVDLASVVVLAPWGQLGAAGVGWP